MKVLIDKNGAMEIRPETPFENYALRKWWEDWQAHKVTLRVSWQDPEQPKGYVHESIAADPTGESRE